MKVEATDVLKQKGGSVTGTFKLVYNPMEPPTANIVLKETLSYIPGFPAKLTVFADDPDGDIELVELFVDYTLAATGLHAPIDFSYIAGDQDSLHFRAQVTEIEGVSSFSETVDAIVQPCFLLENPIVDLVATDNDRVLTVSEAHRALFCTGGSNSWLTIGSIENNNYGRLFLIFHEL